jgi:hypothetical protein
MVLPGAQALFGFQLIAAFNRRFSELDFDDALIHFVALLLVAVSVGLLMAPAAYRRMVERGFATREFVRLASLFIAGALMPLLLGISLDIYVVGRMVFDNRSIAVPVAAAACTFLILGGLWFAFPLTRRLEQQRRTRAEVGVLTSPGSPQARPLETARVSTKDPR